MNPSFNPNVPYGWSHTHAGQQGHRHRGPTDNQIRQGQHNTQHPYPQAPPPPPLATLAHRGALRGFSGTAHHSYSGPNSFDQVTAEQLRRLSRSPLGSGTGNLLKVVGTMGQDVHAQQQQQQQQRWPVSAAQAAYPYPSAHSAGPSAHQFQKGSSTGGHHNVPHHVPYGGGVHPMNPASYYQPQSNLPAQYQPRMKILELSAKPATTLADAKELRHRFLDCKVYSVGWNNQDVRQRLCEFKTTFNNDHASFVTSMQCDGTMPTMPTMPLRLHLRWPAATRQNISDMNILGLPQTSPRALTSFLSPLAKTNDMDRNVFLFEALYDFSQQSKVTHHWEFDYETSAFRWKDLAGNKELGALSNSPNDPSSRWTLSYLPEIEKDPELFQLGIFTSYLLMLILKPYHREDVAKNCRGNASVARSNYDFLVGSHIRR